MVIDTDIASTIGPPPRRMADPHGDEDLRAQQGKVRVPCWMEESRVVFPRSELGCCTPTSFVLRGSIFLRTIGGFLVLVDSVMVIQVDVTETGV